MDTSWAEHIKNAMERKEHEEASGGWQIFPNALINPVGAGIIESELPTGYRFRSFRPPPGLESVPRKKIKPLEKQMYPLLDLEINKIKALNIFKRRLIHNILKYFRYHQVFDRKRYIERQMYNLFPNWFFQLNMDGKIIDFTPQAPLVVQDNLDYIFRERRVLKRADFDPKLLTFDEGFIKQITGVTEIVSKIK